jgi:hypothetical protein
MAFRERWQNPTSACGNPAKPLAGGVFEYDNAGNPAATRLRSVKFFESLAVIGFALSYHSKRRTTVAPGPGAAAGGARFATATGRHSLRTMMGVIRAVSVNSI